MQKRFLLFLLSVIIGTMGIHAQIIVYSASMNGPNESPANASPGIGGAKVTINTTLKTMRVECQFLGLTGNVTACHIHAATAVAFTGTAGVATVTPTFTGFPSGVKAGAYDHTFDMTLTGSYNAAYITANGGSVANAFASLTAAIAAGKSYINIHSSTFGGGEIRGFLIPACIPTQGVTDTSVCPSGLPFTWNGITITGAGTTNKVITAGNSQGCDSIATLNVTVRSAASSEETITRCGSYTWHGNTYSTSGNYTYTTPASNGCDSVVTLHLFISSTDTLRQTVNTCKGFTWNNVTYRKSGVYYFRYNSGTCKLVAILTLNIPQITSTVSITQLPTCHNSTNGSFTVNATSGVSPFLYKNGLTGAYQSSGTFSGLLGNTYRIYIQDATGCEGFTDAIILANPATVTATTVVSPACGQSATGKITVFATGGTGPYMYKNGANGTYQSSNIFSGLVNGVQYRIYVQDANGCTGSTNLVTMTQTIITATGVATDATCNNTANGTVTITATGGAAPYMYKNGATGTYQSSNVMTGLRAGVQYRFYVQDASGCVGNTALMTVGQPAAFTSTTTLTPPTCIGVPDGSATIVPTSGVPPYQYKYGSTGVYQSSNTFNGLAAGDAFRLYFQDATGCVGVGDFENMPDGSDFCNPDGKIALAKTIASKHLQVSLSPNPTSTQFTLIAHAASEKPVIIRVLDVNGKGIYQAKGQTEQAIRFGSNLAPGIYLVEVRQGEEVKTLKAVKN